MRDPSSLASHLGTSRTFLNDQLAKYGRTIRQDPGPHYYDRKTMSSIWKDLPATSALIWTEAMTAATVVHHVYRLGMELLIPSVMLLALPVLLMWWYSRSASPVARWLYTVGAGLIFLYFGIIDGFLDHVLKAIGLQNTTFLPGSDADVIKTVYHLWSPEAGHLFYESTGILTFAVGVGAIYFNYRFLRTAGNKPSATRRNSADAASL